ncbi:MAG TPA: FtsX-like permease family protein, partial [candidate division Zixibacteria bacterium]|nr:FtsX-like permease family protein [candidate division Zixibacteria bacterium]
RNIWRNPRRTLITMSAVTLNTAALIASYALIDGMMLGAVRNVTNVVVGEAQLHAPGYLSDRSLYKQVTQAGAALARADSLGIGAAARMYGYGLMAHETKSAGALFWGVDPARERTAFDLATYLESGEFLSDSAAHGLVIGKKLARSLNVSLGDEVVVVVQAADGSMGNDLYTITGIVRTVGEQVDRGAALMHIDDYRELFVYDGSPHEIAFNSRGSLTSRQIAAVMAPVAPGAEIETWQELLPILNDMLQLFDASMWVFGMIFFLAAGLGVVNTMLMATFERIREFGVRKALGESPWRILTSVTVEALVLVTVAAALGIAVGGAGSWWLEVNGIDTRSIAGAYTVSGIAFDPLWRANLSVGGIVYPTLALAVVCGLAALYPAAIAARTDPVEAMTHV